MSAQFALGAKYVSKLASVEGLASLFPKTPEDIKKLSEAAKESATAAITKIIDDTQTPASSFEGICLATDAARAEFSIIASILSVTKSVQVTKEMRDAATAALTDLSAFSIDTFEGNRALYKKFEACQATGGLKELEAQQETDAEQKAQLFWFEETMKSWKRQGLGLPDEKLEEAKAIKKKISDTGILFDRNIAEYKKEMQFTLDELKGVPEAAIAALKKVEGDDNKRIVGLDYPTYFAIMKNCEVASTRKIVAREFELRAAPENLEVLKDLIKYRHEFANLVGFESTADLDIDGKMAKTTANVRKFIDDLIPRLQKKWAEEKQHLLSDLHPSVTLTEDGKIPSSDITFMMTQYNKKHLAVDETKISEYFPVDNTLQALFDVYEKFFDLEFVRHKNLSDDRTLWHPDVEVLEIHQAPRNKENMMESLVGYFILDLHPREGKYNHACCHSMLPAVRLDARGNKFSPPVAVLICNFPKGTDEKPGLLQFSDAVTAFHEAGHGFHTLLSKTTMATHSGTRVDRTFVEVPSQNLENWMWEKSVLSTTTKHWQTGEPLPEELIDAKLKSRNFFSGRDNLRQLTFASYALEIFSAEFAGQKREDLDTTALFDKIRKRVIPDLDYDEEGRFEAAFGHLNGYSSMYHGYMWSLVLSDDVFEHVKSQNGLLDSKVGKRFIDCVLKPGGSVEPSILLERFLGRPANSEAFLKHLGI